MALEMQDLMALKSMGREEGMTPYEQYMVTHKESKRPSGVAVTGLVLGGTALVIGATGWIFGGMQAAAKGKEAKEAAIASEKVANAQYQATLQLIAQGNQNTKDNLDRLINTVATERQERIAGDVTMSQNITDSISGQQSGSQTATVSQTSAIDATMQNIMQQTLSDAITGKSSLNPTPVTIYSAPAPCGCPGCGCNG